jgi:hypothetical protein
MKQGCEENDSLGVAEGKRTDPLSSRGASESLKLHVICTYALLKDEGGALPDTVDGNNDSNMSSISKTLLLAALCDMPWVHESLRNQLQAAKCSQLMLALSILLRETEAQDNEEEDPGVVANCMIQKLPMRRTIEELLQTV